MKKNKGFTLFELLVSISIVGMLSALAIVSFSSAQKKARDTRRTEDMNSLQKAAEQYYMLNNSAYPLTFNSGTWAVGTQMVLEAFPQDPRGIGYSTPTTQSASAYCFCAISEGNTGNSVSRSCDFVTVGTKSWYCVKNQQ